MSGFLFFSFFFPRTPNCNVPYTCDIYCIVDSLAQDRIYVFGGCTGEYFSCTDLDTIYYSNELTVPTESPTSIPTTYPTSTHPTINPSTNPSIDPTTIPWKISSTIPTESINSSYYLSVTPSTSFSNVNINLTDTSELSTTISVVSNKKKNSSQNDSVLTIVLVIVIILVCLVCFLVLARQKIQHKKQIQRLLLKQRSQSVSGIANNNINGQNMGVDFVKRSNSSNNINLQLGEADKDDKDDKDDSVVDHDENNGEGVEVGDVGKNDHEPQNSDNMYSDKICGQVDDDQIGETITTPGNAKGEQVSTGHELN